MKGFSLTQPYALAIVLGWKRIETRSRRTHFRGWLALHAAKTFPLEERLFASEEYRAGRMPRVIPCGGILAMIEIIGCQPTEKLSPGLSDLERRYGNYEAGRFGYLIGGVRVLRKPIRCSGALSLWDVPASVERELLYARFI